jgi:hypothetical protein
MVTVHYAKLWYVSIHCKNSEAFYKAGSLELAVFYPLVSFSLAKISTFYHLY